MLKYINLSVLVIGILVIVVISGLLKTYVSADVSLAVTFLCAVVFGIILRKGALDRKSAAEIKALHERNREQMMQHIDPSKPLSPQMVGRLNRPVATTVKMPAPALKSWEEVDEKDLPESFPANHTEGNGRGAAEVVGALEVDGKSPFLTELSERNAPEVGDTVEPCGDVTLPEVYQAIRMFVPGTKVKVKRTGEVGIVKFCEGSKNHVSLHVDCGNGEVKVSKIHGLTHACEVK